MSLLDAKLDWDRDERLIPPRVEHPIVAHHHAPTGVMVLVYPVKGRWTEEAIHELGHSLQTTLPKRYIGRIMYYGAIRVAIYLGVKPSGPDIRRYLPFGDGYNENLVDDAPISETLDCTSWALERAVGKLESSNPPSLPPTLLPEPSAEAFALFERAEQAMGPQERVPAPDRHARKFGDEWGRLHQTAGIDIRNRFFVYNDNLY